MTRNSRELSQFASFIDIKDANQNIGVITSMVMNPGGIGIGSPVSDYLSEASSRGAIDPLINWNKSYLLNDVYIEGNLNVDGGTSGAVTGAGATFPKLNVGGLTTTRDLVVVGVTTLSRDTGMGTVYIGQSDVNVSGAQGTSVQSNANLGIAVTGPGGGAFVSGDEDLVHGLVVIDNVGAAENNEVALWVSGRVHFNGGDPLITDPINGGETGLGTEFVVVPKALYYDKVTFLEGINVVKQDSTEQQPEGGSLEAAIKVFNAERGMNPGVAETEAPAQPAIWTNGGIEALQYGRIGYGLSIGEYMMVGNQAPTANTDWQGDTIRSEFLTDIEIKTANVTVGLSTGDKRYNDSLNNRTLIDLQTSQVTQLYPYVPGGGEANAGIGTEEGRFSIAYFHDLEVGPDLSDSQANMVNLNVSLGSTMAFLDIGGTGGTEEDEIYLDVGPGKARFANIEGNGNFYHTGIATILGSLNVISDGYNNAYVATAFQANNVDVYKQDVNNSTSPEFFYPAMANAGISQTDAGAQMFVNPGFYLDAFSTSLFVHNNLSVLGTAINASLENPELRFDLLNYGVTELNLASQARYIDIGEPESAEGGITSIRSEVTELVRLRLRQNDIQASTGDTAITLNEDINVNIAGWVQIGGTYIKCDQNDINIADTSLRADLFKSATDVVIGAEDLGIASIRNNITEVEFLRLNKNTVQASDEATAFTVGLGGTHVSITGDIIVGGNDIQTGFGITNIEMVGDTKTIFYGDIEIRGNEILSSDGSVNMLMFDGQELTSFTGAIRVEGDEIRAGTGDTNMTMIGDQVTIFAGAIEIDGDVIRASNGQDNITMDSDLLTAVAGDLRVGTGTMRAGDGTIAITMEGGTGNVAISSDVTANSAFFNGLEARLNVQDVDIRDNLLTIGLIEDPTNEGTLIPPNVSIGNSGDVGLVMARYDVGLSTHKYAAIYYDNSAGRVAIRTDVEDAGVGAGRDRYLLANGLPSELEVQNLYVNYNTTLGIKTIFEAGNIDTGEEVIDVLNVVNVEIDAGTF